MSFKDPHTRVIDKIDACFQNGIYKPADDYADEGTKIVRISDYNNEGVKNFKKLKRVKLSETEIELFSLRQNDILINRVNSLSHIGKSCVIDKIEDPMVFESNMMRLRLPKASGISAKYIFIALNSTRSRDYFRKVAKPAVAQASINQEDIKSLAVFLPGFEQQIAIADLVSTEDKAIEGTERLIIAKERQYSCLLNRMMNEGKLEDKWNRMKLKEVFSKYLVIEKGKALIKDNATEGRIPVVAGGQTYSCYHGIATHEMKTITISASGAYAGFVWFHDYPIWASDCNVVYAKNSSIEFFYYVLKSMQNKIYALQSGGAQPHIYAKDLKNLLVPVPPIYVQEQIAATLNTARNEIDLLKKQNNAYRKQKRGLMQKLLTGQWRVKLTRGQIPALP